MKREFKLIRKGRVPEYDLFSYSVNYYKVKLSQLTLTLMALEGKGNLSLPKEGVTLRLVVQTRRGAWLAKEQTTVLATIKWGGAHRTSTLNFTEEAAYQVVPSLFKEYGATSEALRQDQAVNRLVQKFLTQVKTAPRPTKST